MTGEYKSSASRTDAASQPPRCCQLVARVALISYLLDPAGLQLVKHTLGQISREDAEASYFLKYFSDWVKVKVSTSTNLEVNLFQIVKTR
ncbi:hypothetical protein RRG08_027404 [Elysia crispata]|uniref:Uncharacterized protein n=1 Tax=Elysia crispata TaxID=231223 RepID=A0AAE1CXH7_9GAST|nr:hypothetical protein RRG08_027404 [Elysia crispata]